MKTVLISGASSGIGMELACLHASKGDHLVLVARNLPALQALKETLEAEHQVKVYCIGKDLSQINAAKEVYQQVVDLGLQIDILINNAGFGDFGFFCEEDWHKIEGMIQVNMMALTQFTKLYLPEMVSRGSGKIMNVASTAAFQPGPLLAVYCATKAYVLSFSEALDNEVRSSGVTITALCPGATESGFMATASMEESGIVKGKKLPSSKEVAEYAYRAMMKGQTVAIHGWMNAILANSGRFVPRTWVVKIARKLMTKKTG